MIKKILFLPLLLIAVAVNAEPVVRVVDTGGSSKDFATDNVRKLVLAETAVDVVNIEGSVLLSVPLAEIVRVEFTEGEATPTAVDQVQSDQVRCTKVLRDGQLFILYNGTVYNVQGRKVTTSR